MRMVRITIEYDMDDTEKDLHDELKDWIKGNVTVADIVTDTPKWITASHAVSPLEEQFRARISELDSQGEVPEPDFMER